jgi:hypothetical protein
MTINEASQQIDMIVGLPSHLAMVAQETHLTYGMALDSLAKGAKASHELGNPGMAETYMQAMSCLFEVWQGSIAVD